MQTVYRQKTDGLMCSCRFDLRKLSNSFINRRRLSRNEDAVFISVLYLGVGHAYMEKMAFIKFYM